MFHPDDSIGVGVWAAAAPVAPSSTREPAALRSVLAPEVVLVPIRGTTDLLDVAWLPYDVHVVVGGAWVTLAEGRARSPMPMAGLGTAIFLAPYLSCGLDYRALADGHGDVRSELALSLAYWPGDLRPAKYDEDE